MPTLDYSNTFRLKGSEVVDFVDKALKTTNLKPESDEPDEPEPKPEPEPKQPSKPYLEPIEYPPITVDLSGAIWNPNVANNNYIVMKKIFRRNYNGSN
jgi:hypothetical protein